MGSLAQLPNNSAQHVKSIHIGPLQAKSDTVINAAFALNTIAHGETKDPDQALVPGVTGRNLTMTVTDADDSSSTAWRIYGWDQFGNYISERFPASGTQDGHGVITGTKIFAKVEKTECLANVAGNAADNISIGTGQKVGLPFLVSQDVHEILDLELQVANQATAAGKKAVNTTNIDKNVHAVDFAQIGAGNVVVAGDSVHLRVRTDCLTPDDLSTYPAR